MKVKFVPQNIECEIKLGQSVLHVAQDNGIYVKSVCKGVPSCAECRVRVVDGDHNVLPPGAEELSLIGTGYFIDRRRLSCQLKCFGDITVDMNEQIAKEKGLIGGQKKKQLAVKDDRVEERTIRSSDDDEEPRSMDTGLSVETEESLDDDDDESTEESVEGGAEVASATQDAASGRPPGQGRRRRRRRGGRGGRGGQSGGGGGQGAGRNGDGRGGRR